MARHRPDRRLNQEEAVPQEREHPRELQQGKERQRPSSPPRSRKYRIGRLYIYPLHTNSQVSDGGVHSHIAHLYALLETAKEVGLKDVYIHFFGDGRDTAPRSAAGYLKDLLAFIEKEKVGEVATIVGRYYAMDRDKRWERVKIAIDGLVKGEGDKVDDPVKAIEERYKKDETDEFLKPLMVNGDAGRIKGRTTDCTHLTCTDGDPDGDTLFFFNYRSDRMREIVSVFGLPDKPMEVDVPKDIVCRIISTYFRSQADC